MYAVIRRCHFTRENRPETRQVNPIETGSAVRAEFRLNGNRALSTTCDGVMPVDSIGADSTLAAGASGLSHGPVTGQYTCVSKTAKETNRLRSGLSRKVAVKP
jgi:hypothetical protein